MPKDHAVGDEVKREKHILQKVQKVSEKEPPRRTFIKRFGMGLAGIPVGGWIGERTLDALADFLYSEPPEAGKFYPGDWDWVAVDCLKYSWMTMKQNAERKIYDVAKEMTELPKEAYDEDGGWEPEYRDGVSWELEIGERNNYNFRKEGDGCFLEVPMPYLKGKAE